MFKAVNVNIQYIYLYTYTHTHTNPFITSGLQLGVLLVEKQSSWFEAA